MPKTQKAGALRGQRGQRGEWKPIGVKPTMKRGNNETRAIMGNIAEARTTPDVRPPRLPSNTNVIHRQLQEAAQPRQHQQSNLLQALQQGERNTARSRAVNAAAAANASSSSSSSSNPFEGVGNLQGVPIPRDEDRIRMEREQIRQFKKIILEAFMKRVKPQVAPSYRPLQFNMNKIMKGIIGDNLPTIMNNKCTFKKPTGKFNRLTHKISAATRKMIGRNNVACADGGVCSDTSLYFKCDIKDIIDIAVLKYSIKFRALIENNLTIHTNKSTGIQKIKKMKDIKTSDHEEIISQSLSFVFYSEEQKKGIEDVLEGAEMALEAERLQLIIDTHTDDALRTRINKLMEGISPPERYISNEELERRIRELHNSTRKSKPKGKGVSKRRKKKGKGKK
jgi:hypothetical protein